MLRRARLADRAEPVDVGIRDGRFTAIGPALDAEGPEEDLGGRLAVQGLVDPRHLDKSCLIGRCRCEQGTLEEAVDPFTPFGDGSLVRMANLHADVARVGTPDGMAECLAMVTTRSAKLLNLADYGIAEGNPADLVVLDADTPANAVAEVAQPLLGLKGGARTFTRPAPTLHAPARAGA